MSRKKYDDKVEVLQELVNRLEELRSLLEVDMAQVEFNRLEEPEYHSMVIGPFDDLIASAGLFLTCVENGSYDDDGLQEDFED